jgi:hypothetical protein
MPLARFLIVYVPLAKDDEEPIEYGAAPTALCEKPLAVAMAFTVSEEETVIGLLYTVELVVGVVPSVV